MSPLPITQQKSLGRIAVIADGNPDSRDTNSGVAYGVTQALRRRLGEQRITLIDGSITGTQRLVLAAVSFRPRRRWWWSVLNLGLPNMIWRSMRRERCSRPAELVLQIRNIYLPSRRPIAVFIDSTSDMANTSWPEWRPSPLLQVARRMVENWQYRRAHHIFTAGEQAAGDLVSGYGISRTKITVVGGGINFEASELAEHPIGDGSTRDPTVLFVGRDYRRKGGDLILAAFSQVRQQFPSARLVIAGCTPDGPVPDHVKVIPWVGNRAEMAELYRNAEIFCLPARHEPYGLVVPEAMAFGLPCIGSRVGALSSIIQHEKTGLVIEPNDMQALVTALCQLLADPDLSRTYGKAGRELALREFTWDRVVDRMMSALSLHN